MGMSLLTFAPNLTELFGLTDSVALVIAILGSQLMDWGLDSTETPLRAYTLGKAKIIFKNYILKIHL